MKTVKITITGPVGSGKSGLACIIEHALASQGITGNITHEASTTPICKYERKPRFNEIKNKTRVEIIER